MSLQKTPISVNLIEGIDTKTDEKIAVKLSEMENCSHQGKGTPKKRKALNSLPKDIEGGGLLSTGKYAFGYNNQSLVATNNAVYVFLENSQKWKKLSDMSLSTLSGEFVGNTGYQSSEMAGIVKTDKEEAYIVISEDGANNVLFIRDIGSGVVTGSQVTELDPRLIQINNEIITVSWLGGISQVLRFRNHSTLTTVDVTADASGRFDLTTDGTNAYLCYQTVTTIKVVKLNTDGTQAAVQTYAQPDTIKTGSNPSITHNGTEFHITFIVSRGAPTWCRYFSVDNTLAVVTAQVDNFQFVNNNANPLSSIIVGTTGDTLVGPLSLWFFYNDRDAVKSGVIEMSLNNFLSTQSSESIGIEFASKPFVYEDSVMALAKHSLPENINWMMLDAYANPQGMVNNFDTSPSNDLAVNTLNSVSVDYEIAYIDDGQFLKKSTIDFLFLNAGDFVEFGGNTFIPGSLSLRYNGLNLVESQFLSRPEITNLAIVGGGTVPAGNYDYASVYEYTEPNGNIVRSEPSLEGNIVNPAPNAIQVTVKSLKISLINDSEIKIVLYRKLNTESVFKKVNEFSVNDRTQDTVTVSDLTVSTAGNEALYSNGDLLPNQTMPAILAYGFSNNRLFGVRSEDTNEILYSNKYTIGEGVFFNNFNTINVEDNQNRRADRVTSIIGMDNKLIIFKRNSILAVFGDGPDNAGVNGAFSEPELVTTDVGCINPRSLSIIDSGIVFKSNKGIRLLSRGMSSLYIGAPVESFNSLNISGAILMEDINQVRWTTSDGITMVYDYFYKQWSYFSALESVACFIHKGKMAILKSDGSLQIEGDSFSENGEFIPQKLTTGWLKMGSVNSAGKVVAGGPQDFQRVYKMLILGEYKSTHKMLVKVYYDYHDYPESEFLLSPTDENYEIQTRPDPSDIENGANDGTYQYSIHFHRQKCQAIKVSIEDVKDGANGESYQLTDLTFIAGKKKGAFKTREGVQY